MHLKHNNLEIDATDPFANCKLDRKQYATTLTQLVNNYASGFVLAIDNKWGTGKTTFVKMWQQQLELNGNKTLYFNAWENDHESDPLVALIALLKTLSSKKSEKSLGELIKKGSVLTKIMLPGLIKGLISRCIDDETLKEVLNEINESSKDLLNEEINNFNSRKQSLIDFKEELTKYINVSAGDKPIVVIIDELDRCRPSYAVEVLEKMKHFFSVPKIVFVLAIDKIQLGNAIRGVYGSDRIDSDEYLRRFIDIEYTIPEPDPRSFTVYLYNYFEFDLFFTHPERIQYGELNRDKKYFIDMAIQLFKLKELSLRQQEKIMAHTKLSLSLFKLNEFVLPELFLILLYLKTIEPAVYSNISNKKYTVQGLVLAFGKIINDIHNEKSSFQYAEAMLAVYYNNYINEDRTRLFEKDNEGIESTSIKSPLYTDESQSEFASVLASIYRDRSTSGISLEHFLRKISLLENVIMR